MDKYEGLTIKCAAIQSAQDGKVYSSPAPARHHDVIGIMITSGLTKPIKGEQGFLLSDGRFVRRIPAKNIARQAGQLLPRASERRELYSEDVW